MSASRARPTGGFELWWWYFMRLSGLVLVFLALGHLIIMHLINNVEVINYAFVASRWAAPRSGIFWRLWDAALCSLAVLHGFNGLRQVFFEYVHRPSRRVLLSTVIWGAATVLILLGSLAILRFEPDAAYLDRFQRANPGWETSAGAAAAHLSVVQAGRAR